MNTKQQKKVEDALIKKAVGYEVEEVVEEFSVDDTQKPMLVKKKRNTYMTVTPSAKSVKRRKSASTQSAAAQ